MRPYLKPADPLLVIIGPSGGGKSTAIRILAKQGLVEITPSWTTRPARPNETNESVEHNFVSPAIFLQKEKEGFFMETAQMFGLPYLYGLPRIMVPQNSRIPAIMLRVNLLHLVAKHYKQALVYHIEDSKARIRERLRRRESAGEAPGSRLAGIEMEIKTGRQLANRIFVNENIDSLVEEIKQSLRNDFGASV
jgi:guanylate kinase